MKAKIYSIQAYLNSKVHGYFCIRFIAFMFIFTNYFFKRVKKNKKLHFYICIKWKAFIKVNTDILLVCKVGSVYITQKLYPELNISGQFSIGRASVIRDYFIKEIHEKEKLSKNLGKCVKGLNYIDKIISYS